jgi:hypothetical protein
MALQTGGQISINDIRVELGQAQANSSLRSLSALAGKSTPDAMSEFYGYSASTAFDISEIGFPDQNQACAEGPGVGVQTLYSSSTSLAINVNLFYDSSLTSSFDGQDQWFFVSNVSYQINSSGRIIDIYNC